MRRKGGVAVNDRELVVVGAGRGAQDLGEGMLAHQCHKYRKSLPLVSWCCSVCPLCCIVSVPAKRALYLADISEVNAREMSLMTTKSNLAKETHWAEGTGTGS